MKWFYLFIGLVFHIPLWAQQNKTADFKTAQGEIVFLPKKEEVKGKMTYTFEVLKNTDTIYLDARNTKANLSAKSKLAPELKVSSKKIYFIYPFKAQKSYSITLEYEVRQPKNALYFVGWQADHRPQIWSQGQGKDTSHWLPSIDDNNDKIQFDITYTVPKNYRAIGNGELVEHKPGKTQERWRYKMEHPISSYLVAVAVGRYKEKEIQSSTGVPLHLYYDSSFSAEAAPTYRDSQKIFDFLVKEIGVDYPFQNYKMVPVRDFLYAGMENASTTLFSERFMVDSIGFIDRNFINVNAHELAHQWFGDFVTEESPKEHWLQEGFASYYALLAEKEIFGDDYFYFKLYESAEKLKTESDKGNGESLLNPKASSLTFYEKGAWALHILKEKMGNTAFRKGIQTYLSTYAYKNVTVDDFIAIMEEVGEIDLTDFVKDWLKQSAFQDQDALETLKKSDFTKSYMEIVSLRSETISDKYESLEQAFDFPVNPYIGQEAVYQLAEETPSSQRLQLYQKAFKTNDILVRQAIAESLTQIPQELRKSYESLLQDDSYRTREKAVFHLWQNFPQKATDYLEVLKDNSGFYDKNLRMLWLTLSLVTPQYNTHQKEEYYQELSHYTSPQFDYSIRQNAFGFLYQINRFTKSNYIDLMEATQHPAWQFKKFASELLQELIKEDRHRESLLQLEDELSAQELQTLQKYLN